MREVLSAVANELLLAQSKCANLDGALGQLLDVGSADHRSAVMRELHAVDLLNQQIAAVAAFLGRLRQDASPDELVDMSAALGAITLGEVAERLRLGTGQETSAPASVPEDVDFF